jgi:hypothetical protein
MVLGKRRSVRCAGNRSPVVVRLEYRMLWRFRMRMYILVTVCSYRCSVICLVVRTNSIFLRRRRQENEYCNAGRQARRKCARKRSASHQPGIDVFQDDNYEIIIICLPQRQIPEAIHYLPGVKVASGNNTRRVVF